MENIKLITWSLNTTHLYFSDKTILSSGAIIPKGTLCGRKPRKKGGFGKFGDAIAFPFGSTHLQRMSFCKDCTLKLAKLFETQQAFHRNVTRHPLELLSDGMLDGNLASVI